MTILSTRLPASICPSCFKELDAATGDDGRRPKPGDAGLCFYCLHPFIFADDLSLREPTRREQRQLEKSKDMVQLLAAWRAAHGKAVN